MLNTLNAPLRSTSSTKNLECPTCHQRAHQHMLTYPGHSPLFRSRAVARCVTCNLVYMYPMVSAETLNTYFRSGAGRIDQDKPLSDNPTAHHQSKARADFILSHLAFSGKTTVLDIGAGDGILKTYLKKALPKDIDYFAVDPDPKAQEGLEKQGIRWSADLETFLEKEFNLIVLSHVLDLINDPMIFLKKLRQSFSTSAFFIEVSNEDYRFKFDLEPHVLFFSPRTLAALLNQAGFEVIALESCGSKWETQRRFNEKNHKRNTFLSQLPFRKTLKKFWANISSDQVVVASYDPLATVDPYECATYGENRIWIRCLAKPRGGHQ